MVPPRPKRNNSPLIVLRSTWCESSASQHPVIYWEIPDWPQSRSHHIGKWFSLSWLVFPWKKFLLTVSYFGLLLVVEYHFQGSGISKLDLALPFCKECTKSNSQTNLQIREMLLLFSFHYFIITGQYSGKWLTWNICMGYGYSVWGIYPKIFFLSPFIITIMF